MEDLKNELLLVIPDTEDFYADVQQAEHPLDIVRGALSKFGMDKTIWPEWLIEVENLYQEHTSSTTSVATLNIRQKNHSSIKSWLLNAVGQKFDSDDAHGAQCKDFANAYAKWLEHPLEPSDAAETWSIKQDSFWAKVPFKSGEQPDKGDIVVWDSWKQNAYGHIAVVLDASEDSFRSVDQNWKDSNLETGSEASIITHNYTDPKILGYLRPNFGQ